MYFFLLILSNVYQYHTSYIYMYFIYEIMIIIFVNQNYKNMKRMILKNSDLLLFFLSQIRNLKDCNSDNNAFIVTLELITQFVLRLLVINCYLYINVIYIYIIYIYKYRSLILYLCLSFHHQTLVSYMLRSSNRSASSLTRRPRIST